MDLENEEVDRANLDMATLQAFFDNNGCDIIVGIRDRLAQNYDIYELTSRMEQKYCGIDTNEEVDLAQNDHSMLLKAS